MEPAILSVLAVILTVMLYLDRTRRADIRDLRADNASLRADIRDLRADNASLRADMNAGFAELRKEMAEGAAALRKEMAEGAATLREEIRISSARLDTRIDQLTTSVINLAESLGQVKGRTEVLVAAE